jgi:hypothetical protein
MTEPSEPETLRLRISDGPPAATAPGERTVDITDAVIEAFRRLSQQDKVAFIEACDAGMGEAQLITRITIGPLQTEMVIADTVGIEGMAGLADLIEEERRRNNPDA